MATKHYKKITIIVSTFFFLLFFLNYTAIAASWTSGGPSGAYVNSLAMATNPDVIYAGTEGGVFKTVDGGDTWTKTGFPETPVRVVQVAPENPEPAIDFDDDSAPCVFTKTTALTNEYSALGVVFSGPGGNDGGAILDECAGGFITGHSSPNFLAFDINASLSDGGVPRGPETITFNSPITYVKIKVGSVDGTLVQMKAYDALDNLIDSDWLYAFNTVKTMSMSGTGITTVVIDFPIFSRGTTLVLDDLSFVVQPVGQHPDIVYAGSDDGMYKSEDGGSTWTPKGLSGARVNAIAIDPQNPETLYAGTSGDTAGIFKSTDGGETWQEKLSEGLDAVQALLIDTNSSLHIYAGVLDAAYHRRGIRRSTDGGENWESRRVRSGDEDIVALAMTAAGVWPAAIYAINDDFFRWNSDVYKSTDRGDSWTQTNTPFISGAPPWALAVDPNNPNVVYVGTRYKDGGFYRSTDGGGTWLIKTNGLPPLPPDRPSSIVIDPRKNVIDPQPSTVYVGLSEGGGVYKSIDEAESWNISGPNNTSINGLAVDPTSSNTVFAAIKGSHLAKTTNGGASWDYLVDSPGDCGAVTIDPQESSTMYTGLGWDSRTDVRYRIYKSTDGGQNWTSPGYLFDVPGLGEFGFSDIWVKPNESSIIVVAVAGWSDLYDPGGVWKSFDGGATWVRTGGFWATTLANHPTTHNVLYFGSKQYGYVFESTNSGSSWTDISPSAPPGECWVTEVRDIEVDLNSDVYAATDEGLRKRHDAAWAELSGLPTDDITALAIDRSTSPGIVYVGTEEDGIFASQDGGNTWIPLGLGNLSINKLAISASQPKMLYAGTAYGGVWSRMIGEATPDISVSPTSHDFGGSTLAAQTFTIRNTGDADLELETLSITGTDPYEFSIENDNCSGQTIAQSGICTVDVVFSPTSEGSKSAALSIPSNDPDTPTLEVPLSGTGVIPGDANGDSQINVLDVIVIINHILGTNPASGSPDCNEDGTVNVQDVICVINKILGP